MNQPTNNQDPPAAGPGAALKAAREAKGATPGAVAEATRIKVQIIEAIERDDYSGIAAPTYAKGFIKLYAEHLGLDVEPLLHAYTEQHLPSDPRRGAARRVAAGARGEPAEPSLPGTSRWIDVLPLKGVAVRVLVGVAALVVAVLLLSGLVRLVAGVMGSRGERAGGEEQPETEWNSIAEPPDPVLPVPGESSP